MDPLANQTKGLSKEKGRNRNHEGSRSHTKQMGIRSGGCFRFVLLRAASWLPSYPLLIFLDSPSPSSK